MHSQSRVSARKKSLLWRILSNVFATQDVRMTGLYESWWFSHFLQEQDDGDLPYLGRLPGGEAEVENV